MSDERTDLYAVLGLDESATQAQIRHAFRGLLRRHHPDTRVLPDSAQAKLSDAALQHALAAYAVLGDPVRRARYDQQARRHGLHPRRATATSTAPSQAGRGPAQPPIQAGPVHWHRP
jgi:DnaJ-class molecular chaperone